MKTRSVEFRISDAGYESVEKYAADHEVSVAYAVRAMLSVANDHGFEVGERIKRIKEGSL